MNLLFRLSGSRWEPGEMVLSEYSDADNGSKKSALNHKRPPVTALWPGLPDHRALVPSVVVRVIPVRSFTGTCLRTPSPADLWTRGARYGNATFSSADFGQIVRCRRDEPRAVVLRARARVRGRQAAGPGIRPPFKKHCACRSVDQEAFAVPGTVAAR